MYKARDKTGRFVSVSNYQNGKIVLCNIRTARKHENEPVIPAKGGVKVFCSDYCERFHVDNSQVRLFVELANTHANIDKLKRAGLQGWQEREETFSDESHPRPYSGMIYTLDVGGYTLSVVQRLSADRSYSIQPNANPGTAETTVYDAAKNPYDQFLRILEGKPKPTRNDCNYPERFEHEDNARMHGWGQQEGEGICDYPDGCSQYKDGLCPLKLKEDE